MTRRSWIVVGIAVAVLLAALGNYGTKIAGAYSEVAKVQLNLDATDARLDALEKRVKELEDVRDLDLQHGEMTERK